jgi:hypothetical protein
MGGDSSSWIKASRMYITNIVATKPNRLRDFKSGAFFQSYVDNWYAFQILHNRMEIWENFRKQRRAKSQPKERRSVGSCRKSIALGMQNEPISSIVGLEIARIEKNRRTMQ